mgnify:CR=1 FL=1
MFQARWMNSPLELLAPPMVRLASDQISNVGSPSLIGDEQFPANPASDTHHCKLKIDF